MPELRERLAWLLAVGLLAIGLLAIGLLAVTGLAIRLVRRGRPLGWRRRWRGTDAPRARLRGALLVAGLVRRQIAHAGPFVRLRPVVLQVRWRDW